MAVVVCTQDAKAIASLPLESVVELSGTVQLRPAGQANKASHRFMCLLKNFNVTQQSSLLY